MIISIVNEDNTVYVNGRGLVVSFSVPANVWAVQWDSELALGSVEFNDGTPTAEISDFAPYQSALDAYNVEATAIEAESVATTLVSIEMLREVRNSLLAETDYRMLPDYTGTDVAVWQAYRQSLRDMTEGYVAVENPAVPKHPLRNEVPTA